MTRRRWLVPEVIQTSAMDCGPAALASLLAGHDVPVVFDRLREACQTDVDGTSIDALEEIARRLGLDAEQVIVPVDHVVLPSARCLPALAVVQDGRDTLHFLVLWRRVGARIQVMDPRRGRWWATIPQVEAMLHVHEHPVDAGRWDAWLRADELQAPIAERLRTIRVAPRPTVTAGLDAATRFVTDLVRRRALRAGPEAEAALTAVLDELEDDPDAVPEPMWSARPGDDGEVVLRGAVLVRVRGRRPSSAALGDAGIGAPSAGVLRGLAPELLADRRVIGVVAGAIAVGALTTTVEALLLRGVLDLVSGLSSPPQRLAATAVGGVFLAGGLLLGVPVSFLIARAGRHLEIRLRARFLAKLTRLGDPYLSSRPVSDLAARSHVLHLIRDLPDVARGLAANAARMGFVTLGITWLSPAVAPIALLVGGLSVAVPLAVHRTHIERDLRVRTHGGALSRFTLDGMLGLIAVRTHGAETALRTEHEALLTEWGRARLALQRLIAGSAGIQVLLGMALAAALLWFHVEPAGGELGAGAGAMLLLVYWALLLPTYGELLAGALRQVPYLNSVAARVLEPLAAEELAPPQVPSPERKGPMTLELRDLGIQVGGHPVLEGVSAAIGFGEHVAIVGGSGAGKSTLIGALLGFHPVAAGEILVDGAPLTDARLPALRRVTAWIDPAVQLWNRSLLANLRYGAGEGGCAIGEVLDRAGLVRVLEGLPEGMRTPLGEGGSRVSGGEGNRVRFGRALGRSPVELVLLDEAFRGLDRASRTTLLAAARAHWSDATLLCATHDLLDTRTFHRVLVLDGGRLVQDGPPAELMEVDGPYRTLLAKAEEVDRTWWGYRGWRRFGIAGGVLGPVDP